MLVKEYLRVESTELHVIWEGLGPEVFRPNIKLIIYCLELILIKVEEVVWLIRQLEKVLSHHQKVHKLVHEEAKDVPLSGKLPLLSQGVWEASFA
jgi:hypothetical protein